MNVVYDSGLDVTFLAEAAPGEDLSPDLTALLADLKTASYLMEVLHWTYRGENFVGMHDLFGDGAYALAKIADSVAELAMAHSQAAAGLIPRSVAALATSASVLAGSTPPTLPGVITLLRYICSSCDAILAKPRSEAAVQDVVGRVASDVAALSWKISSSQPDSTEARLQ